MKFLVGLHSQNIGSSINSLKASEVHKMLNVKTRFSAWIQSRIDKNSFIEDFDYIKQEVKTKGRAFTEYYITFDMARHLCMMENNEIGMSARKYFIEIEKSHMTSQELLIDGKNPRKVIAGYKSKIAQMNLTIAELKKAQKVLPPPSVDVEPYRQHIAEQLALLNNEKYYRSHFENMAGNLVSAFRIMKQVPTRIRAMQGQLLDFPEVYKLLDVLAVELSGVVESQRRVG